MKIPRRTFLALVTATFAAATVVVGGELIVRLSLRFAPERDTLDYADVRDGMLLKPGFSAEVAGGDGGTVTWTNNAQGFRATREFEPELPPGTLRILSLGDSFTAGFRVDDDETFSRRLEIWLNDTLGPTEVLIAGVEEPNHGLEYFQETGSRWSPHLLLFGITLGNDIAQSYVARHPEPIGFANGLENHTFPPESFEGLGPANLWGRALYHATLRSRLFALVRPRRAIVSWYGHNDPPRLFDPINGLGMYLAEPPVEIDVAFERLFQILDELQALCRGLGIELVIGIFPQPYQVQPGDWDYARYAYGLRPAAFDLNAPDTRILAHCAETGLTCIDPTDFMREVHEATRDRLYFRLGDMHWNARGHEAWLEGAKAALVEVVAPLFERLNP